MFVALMKRALQEGDEHTLMLDLMVPEWWDEYSVRPGKRRLVQYRDPYDVQAKRFAITDFNTWYVRGVSRRLLDEGQATCQLFRAGAAYEPRPGCRRLEGAALATADVYAGHRIRYHHPRPDRTALSAPFGPNCHHSIRRLSA